MIPLKIMIYMFHPWKGFVDHIHIHVYIISYSYAYSHSDSDAFSSSSSSSSSAPSDSHIFQGECLQTPHGPCVFILNSQGKLSFLTSISSSASVHGDELTQHLSSSESVEICGCLNHWFLSWSNLDLWSKTSLKYMDKYMDKYGVSGISMGIFLWYLHQIHQFVWYFPRCTSLQCVQQNGLAPLCWGLWGMKSHELFRLRRGEKLAKTEDQPSSSDDPILVN